MSATPVTAAALFAIKTWAAVAVVLVTVVGLYVSDVSCKSMQLAQAKAAIDCRHFNPGYYDWEHNEAMSSAILDTAKNADQTFSGLGLIRDDVRDGVASCLKKSKHKDFIVVFSGCRDPDWLAKLDKFARVARIKRLLVLGDHSDGISVDYDSGDSHIGSVLPTFRCPDRQSIMGSFR
jgi:hypothetical protein